MWNLLYFYPTNHQMAIYNVKIEFGDGEGKVSLDAIAEREKKYPPKEKAEAIKAALKFFEMI